MKTRLTKVLVLSAVAVTLATTAASALDRRVRVHNKTSYIIEQFYASNVGAKSWEEDILGRDVIHPGQYWTINIDDGTGYCKYDFLAVFEDGEQVTKRAVNVCEVTDFSFTQ